MKKIFTIGCLILGLFGLFQYSIKVFAEGGTGLIPSSGTTSRIKTIDDALIGLGFGTTGSGAWGDWGMMWNRIYSAGIWNATLGDAVASDVALGKKFYAGTNRTLLTGTYSAPASIDYSLQKNATEDDGAVVYKSEESVWTNEPDGTVGIGVTGLSSGEIKKDNRTGLIWTARSSATYSNSFTELTDGTRPENGNAVGFCNYLNTIEYGERTSWYLPTQKELMQAYIDGIYSQDPDFGTTNAYWSSSERSDGSANAWMIAFNLGAVYGNNKSTAASVRCVSED